MKILVIIAAAILSGFAGVGAAAATSAWLLRLDPSAQGIGAAYLFAAMLYVFVAALAFGIAAFRSAPARRLQTALGALLIAPLILAAFSLLEGGLKLGAKDLAAWIALFAPMWVVAIVQWVVLRWWIRRAAARAPQ
jgi:hypothetical protein